MTETHAFNATYVLAQVGWPALGIALLVVASLAWRRFERRLHARHATIHTFPTRSASVTRIYGDKDGAA